MNYKNFGFILLCAEMERGTDYMLRKKSPQTRQVSGHEFIRAVLPTPCLGL